MTTNIRELKSLNTGQKSFYKKAWIHEDISDNDQVVYIQLQSYETIVVDVEVLENGEHHVIITNMHSNTTKRHIKEFILQLYTLNEWNTIAKDYKKGVTEWIF